MRPHVMIDGTRTDAGKKIDTWKFKLPDETLLTVDIALHTRSAAMQFSAGTRHPVFHDLSQHGTDLEVLRDSVQDWVRARIEDHYGADWGHGRLVECDYTHREVPEDRVRVASSEVRLTLSVNPVRFDATRPVGNRGETTVIFKETPQTILQRSHSDTFEKVGNDMSTENMRLYRESGATTSRVLIAETADLDARLRDLQQVLLQFSAGIADRLSPGRISLEGLPDGAELVTIMRRAADPACSVDVAEITAEFRM